MTFVNLKALLKNNLPDFVIDKLVYVYRRIINRKCFKLDKIRFVKFYAKGTRHDVEQQVASQLIFYSHSIEKGLSHQDLRLGFGKAALKEIAKAIGRYSSKGYDKNSDAYVNTLSVLRQYILIHVSENYDVGYIKEILGSSVFDEAVSCTSNLGGTSDIPVSDKVNREKNFERLFNGRQSIREYGSGALDKDKVTEAISITMKCPSICNRQSSRLLCIYSKEKIEKALIIQNGLTGYPVPPALFVVLTDIRNFVGINERNQPFVDGGLFAMSFLLSLEYVGLAACPLNTMFSPAQDKKFRDLLGLENYEIIIMSISAGHFPNIGKVPKSFRYSADQVTRDL